MSGVSASLNHDSTDWDIVSWYCVRTQPKHEHIAAGNLRAVAVEVFSPRLRLKRATMRGPVWFTEALFPGYIFARCGLVDLVERVRFTSGVQGVLNFGGRCPVVPDEVVVELRQSMEGGELLIQTPDLAPGTTVRIAGGIFHGVTAVVTQVLSSKHRVQVLLDMLGRATAAEIPAGQVVAIRDHVLARHP